MESVLYLYSSLLDKHVFAILRGERVYIPWSGITCMPFKLHKCYQAVFQCGSTNLHSYQHCRRVPLLTCGVLCSFHFIRFSWRIVQCFLHWLAVCTGQHTLLCLSFAAYKKGLIRALYFWEINSIIQATFVRQWQALSGPSPVFDATHHVITTITWWLSIPQRESSFEDKGTGLCKGSKAEKGCLCWKNSEKFPLSLHKCLVRVRDRNVWLATHSIVLFQKEGD